MRPIEQWIDRVLGFVAAAVLFAMMSLTFVDVFGRKFFTKPIYGAYEITEFLMGMLIFSALPLVTARQGHVTIDVFDQWIPGRLRRAQHMIVTAISAIVLAFIAWRLWLLSFDFSRTKEVAMTLHIPYSPFALLFALLAVFATLACIVNIFRPAPRAGADSVETAA